MRPESVAIVHASFSRLLLAFCISLLPLAGCTPGDPEVATAAMSESGSATMDDVLEELKVIRQLLEKIEKQGTAPSQQRPSRPTTATVTISADKPVLGSDTAPVTVVEFTDYQCPYCLRFSKTTFPYLQRDFIDTGKVRWVALNLPLDFHQDARKAAQAAHCAGDQDRFWEMRLELFKHPKELGAEHLPVHAATLGLDADAFKECLASDRHLDTIDQDAKDARSVRLTGTPSFIIGKTAKDRISGQVVVGAQPLNVFSAAIKKALGEDANAESPADNGKTPGAG